MSELFGRVEVNDTFKLYKLITILIIAFITVTTFAMPANAFFFNVSQSWFNSSDEGYFKKIEAPSLYGKAIKLNDGRLLFIRNEKVIIFNPKTNRFIEKTPLNQNGNANNTIYDGILLNNGKILFAGAMIDKFPDKFSQAIYWKMKEEPDFDGQEYRKLRKQPLDEKMKVYNKYFKKHPELNQEYQVYLEEYNSSMRAQLYDPRTNQFKYSGKLNIRRENPKLTLLKDGRIFVIGGLAPRSSKLPIGVVDKEMHTIPQQAEIYDPKTGEFTLAAKLPKGGVRQVVALDNGNLLIIGAYYTIYNPKNNSYSKQKEYSKKLTSEWVKLKDGRLLFIAGKGSDFKAQKVNNPPKELKPAKNMQVYTYEWHRYNAMTIKIYDPTKDEISTVGSLSIPRGEIGDFGLTVLKDGRVLITGGIKDVEKYKLGDRVKTMNESEIFNPETGKSTLTNKMNNKVGYHFSILLDDGRVLLYKKKKVELYMPKNYKK